MRRPVEGRVREGAILTLFLTLLVILLADPAPGEPEAAPGATTEAHGGADRASENRCVACHGSRDTIRQLPAWEREHFILWSRGEHGRSGVTCDACHGGDPAAKDAKAAHAVIRPSSDPESPIHYQRLPKTCGACHEEVYEAFVRSRHHRELVRDHLAPTCTTCHGFMMDVESPSAAVVESCELCHHRDPGGVKPQVVEEARAVFSHLARTRRSIGEAEAAIALAESFGAEPGQAPRQLGEAKTRLDTTGARWHRFHLDAFDQELAEIEALAEAAKQRAMQAVSER